MHRAVKLNHSHLIKELLIMPVHARHRTMSFTDSKASSCHRSRSPRFGQLVAGSLSLGESSSSRGRGRGHGARLRGAADAAVEEKEAALVQKEVKSSGISSTRAGMPATRLHHRHLIYYN